MSRCLRCGAGSEWLEGRIRVDSTLQLRGRYQSAVIALMDILLRNFTDTQRAAMEKARGDSRLQVWGANALLDAAGYKGSRDNLAPKKGAPSQKAPRKKAAAKEPAKKRVPERPAAKAEKPAKAPAKKSATKPKPASSANDETWRLEPQFRDKSKKKL